MFQTRWAEDLNPVLNNAVVNGVLLKSVVLANGVTVVNHKLGRTPQGWFIADINAAATIYRSQPFDPLTLTLTSNAAVTINLWVF